MILILQDGTRVDMLKHPITSRYIYIIITCTSCVENELHIRHNLSRYYLTNEVFSLPVIRCK